MRLLSLGFGQFYGRKERELGVRGFEVASHLATGRREDVALHTHPDAHIVFVTRGTYLSAARPGAQLTAPVTVFNPPGVVHRDCFAGPGGAFVAISISRRAYARVADVLSLASEPAADSGTLTTGLAYALLRQCLSEAPPAALETESLCVELLGEFAGRPAADSARMPGWMRRARELIRDRCAEEITIAEISRDIGVHRVYFARSFRRFFGCTPGGYLRRCRIEKAGALLRDKRLSLADIAVACGFADQSHLCKALRRQCRITPGEFRRLL